MQTDPSGNSFVAEIMKALAAECGFECADRWFRDIAGIYRCRWIHPNAKTESPPIPDGVSMNPCCEIPMQYELYIQVQGTQIIMNNQIKFDLNDPQLVERMKAETSDLNALRDKIKKFHYKDLRKQGYV